MHEFLFYFFLLSTQIPNNHLPNGILRTDILMAKKKINWILTFHFNLRCNFFLSAIWMNLFCWFSFLTRIRNVHVLTWNFHLIAGFELLSTCIIPTKIHYVFLFFYMYKYHTHIHSYTPCHKKILILVSMKVQYMAVLVVPLRSVYRSGCMYAMSVTVYERVANNIRV